MSTGPTNGQAFNPIAYRVLTSSGAVPVATWPQSSSDWATVGIALKPAGATYTYSYTYDNMGRLTKVADGGS